MTIPDLSAKPAQVLSKAAAVDGSYVMPNNLTDIARWSGTTVNSTFMQAPLPGCAPGNANMAIMFAHTGLDDKTGPFVNQGSKLKVGATATLSGVDTKGHAGTLTLRVCAPPTSAQKYNPNGKYDPQLFVKALNAAPACTRVVTATCKGSINWAIQHHLEVGLVFWDIVAWTPSKGK
jgi:hypothetical protein